jgi:hypothetical protein
MNIIELAREAGFGIDEAPIDQPYVIQPLRGKIDDELTRFAQLVRAEVLEEAAELVDGLQGCGLYADKQAVLCAAAIRALKGEKTWSNSTCTGGLVCRCY